MENRDSDVRLSRMSTQWTLLFQAIGDEAPDESIRAAQSEVLARYEPVVRRYLRGLLKGVPDHEQAIEDCFQEFSLRLVDGRFRSAAPHRGRFRDYLKRVLQNLAVDYRRQLARRPGPLTGHEEDLRDDALEQSDREFYEIWRDELIARAMAVIAAQDVQTGQQLHDVLTLRISRPELRSAEMASLLSESLGRPVTDGWVRKRLFVARERLAELMIEDVRQSLSEADDGEVVDELAELGLLSYCGHVISRRGRGA
jgi:RNA polymerase sigma factor (sigma-70 family)